MQFPRQYLYSREWREGVRHSVIILSNAIRRKARERLEAIDGIRCAFQTQVLSAYLVSFGRRPAATITPGIVLDQEGIGTVKELLGGIGTPHAFDRYDVESGLYREVLVAKSTKRLQKLRTAKVWSEPEIPESALREGLALGYPRNAAMAYALEPWSRGLAHVQNIISAIEKGIEIPRFAAYLSHIPAAFDYERGAVSEPSMSMATSNMTFVMRSSPELDARVVESFRKNIKDHLRKEAERSPGSGIPEIRIGT